MSVAKRKVYFGLVWVGLVAGGCTQDYETQMVTETFIGVEGGIAQSHDGLLQLVVPPGALSALMPIRITTMSRTLPVPDQVSSTYALEPDGLEINAELRVFATGDDLVLAEVDGHESAVLDASEQDTAQGFIFSPIEYLSWYTAVWRYRPCRQKQCGMTCTICPPQRPNCQEPPGPRVCSASRACVPAAQVMCNNPVDAGPIDGGPGLDGGLWDGGPGPDASPPPRMDSGVWDGGPGPDASPPPRMDGGVWDGGPGPDASPPPRMDGGIWDGGPGPDAGPSNHIIEIEPNDSFAMAQPIPTPVGVTTTVEGSIVPQSDVDYLEITVPPGTYTLNARTYGQAGNPAVCNGIDTRLFLFDGNQTFITQDDDGGPNFCSWINIMVSGGTYYLRVESFGNSTSFAYFLDLLLTPANGRPDGGFWDGGPGPDAGPPPRIDGGFWDAGPRPDAGDGGQPPRIDGGFWDAGPGPDGGPVQDGGTQVPGAFVEQEVNDTPAQANVLPMVAGGLTVQADIQPGADVDYFVLTVPPGNYAFEARTYTQPGNPLVCSGIDTIVGLYDSAQNLIRMDDDGGTNFCSYLSVGISGGTYYVRVRGFGTSTVFSYLLDLSLTPSSGTPDAGSGGIDSGVVLDGGQSGPDGGIIIPDAGTNGPDGGALPDTGTQVPGAFVEQEVNDTPAQANVLPPVTGVLTVQADIQPSADVDYFILTVPPGTYEVEARTYTQPGNPLICSGIDTVVGLYDSAQNLIEMDDDGGTSFCSYLSETLSGGTYYVQVRAFSSTSAFSYLLDLSLTPASGMLDAGVPDSGP